MNKITRVISYICLLFVTVTLHVSDVFAQENEVLGSEELDVVIMKVDAPTDYEETAKTLLENIELSAVNNGLEISKLSGQFTYSDMHAMTQCGQDIDICHRLVTEYSGTQQIIFAVIAEDGKTAELTWYRIGAGILRQLSLPIASKKELSFAANAIVLGRESVEDTLSKAADKVVFIDVDTETEKQEQLFYQIKLATQRNLDKRDVTVSLAPYKRSEVELVAGCDSNLDECMHAIATMSDAEEIILGDVNNDVYHLIWYSTTSGVKGESYAQITSDEDVIDLAERLVLDKLISLEVISEELGVEVFVDGLLYGVTFNKKQKFRIPAGSHELRFKKRGAYSVQKTIDIQAPEVVHVDFEFMPASPIEKGFKYGGYTLIASGLVIGFSGVYFAVKGKDINENPKAGETKEGHKSRVMAKYKTANALFGVGAGLAVIGTTLTILGYTLDFYDDPDAHLSAWFPKVDMDFGSESTQMTLGWTF